MPKYRVKTEADRAHVLAEIKRAPLTIDGKKFGFQVSARRRTRSDEQNDLMWDLLGEFERQGAEVRGRTFPKEAWKAMMMNALGYDNDMLPTLDGESFFAEGYRSSQLKVGEMSNLIERIFQEGATRGVTFKQDQHLRAET